MMTRVFRARPGLLALSLGLTVLVSASHAGEPYRRVYRPVTPAPVVVVRPVAPVAVIRPVAPAPVPDNRVARTGMLGSFVPGNYITIGGNGLRGGGYSPLGSYGETSMDLYGPFAALRATSAPVVGYTRGYDGRLNRYEGTSFSTPFLPSQSPVVYPTRASNYSALRGPGIRPQTGSAMNWVDQN